ncbi:MAG TPA: hypothetical protein VKE74_25135, partial [Gemmataceae bacterium]|nr:hypothetical protein [Gemmataceae bacterium]
MTGTRIGRWAAAAVMALGLYAAALAQPPGTRPAPQPAPADVLAEAKARQKIADQKAEAEVLAAIIDADKLARTNPTKAVQQLRAAQSNLDLSAAISPEARKSLTTLLQAKINAINATGPAVAPGPRMDPNAAAVRSARKAELDQMVTEVKEVREGLNDIAKLRAAGRDSEADAIARRLTAKYPNNPSVIFLGRKDATADLVADNRLFAAEQSDRVNKAFMAVDRSSLPATGDVEFPKDWPAKSQRRLQQNQLQLTEKEKKIISALDKPVTVDFNSRPLEEALQDLSTQLDQPLAIDTKSLNDLNVDLQKKVNFQARGVSGRTALRQVLATQGLTFVVKDEMIQVVTVEKARDMLVTRVYYLGDVVQGVGPFSGSLTWGPYLDYQQTMANVQVLTDSIQDSIDPLSWKKNGGPSTVT